MNAIIFYLACAGATLILQTGKLFGWLHRRLKPTPAWCFFQCELCLGFWMGIAMSCLWHFTGHDLPVGFDVIGVFSNACVAAIVTYIIGRTISDEGFKITKIE